MSSIDLHPEKNIIRVQLRQNLVLSGVGEPDMTALECQLSIVDRQKGEFLLHQGVKEMEQYFVLDGILQHDPYSGCSRLCASLLAQAS